MKGKIEIGEDYQTWREDYIKALWEDSVIVKGGCQSWFYGKLLILSFEELYRSLLSTIKVDAQFEK